MIRTAAPANAKAETALTAAKKAVPDPEAALAKASATRASPPTNSALNTNSSAS
jgi:hypothetical protein